MSDLGDKLVDALKASIADGTTPHAAFTVLGDDVRKKMAEALRTVASALEGGAEHVSGGLLVDVEPGEILVLLADLRLRAVARVS